MIRTLDVEGCNSKDLIQIILRDLGLTAQVLRVANSILYNHSDRPILSINHATTLLGWLQVRNLVGAVREMEQFAQRAPGLPELLLGSVLTAVQSRDVAAAVGYPRPEEAYICGLFRNLGEILIGCHFPDEYSSVLLQMEKEKIPERAACFRVLDFCWEDLGMRVASGWNMPAQVKLSMQTTRVVGSTLDRSLASIANFGHTLTRTLYRKGASIHAVQGEMVIDPSGRLTALAERDLGRIVNSAAIETSQAFSALNLSTASLRLSKQAERARAIL
ncbi:MAG TPA: HDOD domain-containing protein, partial [Bryobacteraceae bacterium]|nr:HDOD domain-containing protein [Bryobacteraceae bacterium]